MKPTTWRKSSRSANGNCVEVGCVHDVMWRKSSRSSGSNNSNCVEVACMHDASWRKSAHSSGSNNSACVEVACAHDASWHKSSHSGGNGPNCVEVAPVLSMVAVRDSKLDTTGDFPYLSVSSADWAGLLTAIRTGDLA